MAWLITTWRPGRSFQRTYGARQGFYGVGFSIHVQLHTLDLKPPCSPSPYILVSNASRHSVVEPGFIFIIVDCRRLCSHRYHSVRWWLADNLVNIGLISCSRPTHLLPPPRLVCSLTPFPFQVPFRQPLVYPKTNLPLTLRSVLWP